MVGFKQGIVISLLVTVLLALFSPIATAQDFVPVKLNPYYRESIVNAPQDKVIKVLTDYGQYRQLFPQISNTSVHAHNSIHSIVYYKVEIMRKEFAALLRFKEREFGNVFQIDCESIKLYGMDRLDGQLQITSLGHNRTKLKVRAMIYPSIYVPNFIYQNVMNKLFDEAIRKLTKLTEK